MKRFLNGPVLYAGAWAAGGYLIYRLLSSAAKSAGLSALPGNVPVVPPGTLSQTEVDPGDQVTARFVVRGVPVEHTDASLYSLRNQIMNRHKWRGELRRRGIETDPATIKITWKPGAGIYYKGGRAVRDDAFLISFDYAGKYEGPGVMEANLGAVVTITVTLSIVAAALLAAAVAIAITTTVVLAAVWVSKSIDKLPDVEGLGTTITIAAVGIGGVLLWQGMKGRKGRKGKGRKVRSLL